MTARTFSEFAGAPSGASDVRLRSRLRWGSRALSAASIALGVAVLAGWALEVPLLKSAGSGFVAMKPNTALCFILLGTALLLPRSPRVSSALALGAAALASTALLSYATGIGTPLDDLLYRETGPIPPGTQPGRMAATTAVCFLLLAAALLAFARERVSAAQTCAILALPFPVLTCLSYLFGVSLNAMGAPVNMAIHTALGLLVLALATAFARPGQGVLAPLSSAGQGGYIVRRTFVPLAVLYLLCGWARVQGEKAGLFDSPFGSALIVTTMFALFSVAAWVAASSLERVDAERLRAFALLSERNAELARSNAELEQFAYVASHDLQEPLRAVAGCTQLLGRKYQGRLDPAADDLIRHSVEGATRMQRQIEDLLAFSRVATRGRSPETTSSEAALADALVNLRVAIAESGARVEHGPLPEVTADPPQLVQLLQNLVGNAVKFRAPGRPPLVRVTAEPDPPFVRFTVKDNGIGIDPQYFARIFGVFARLHTRTEFPGTGIGLAICKRIVERHGGRLWVESVPGEGSSFHFTLPQGGTT